jgi:hypothetical protein
MGDMARSDDALKYCPKCQQYRLPERFGANALLSDGKAAYCKDCFNAYQRKWKAANGWRLKKPAT